MPSERVRQWPCPNDVREIMLDRLVRNALTEVSWNQARQLIKSSKILVNGEPVRDPSVHVHPGDVVTYDPDARIVRTPSLSTVPILHLDSQIVVVNKPAGISTVPYDETERDTLYHRVKQALGANHRHGTTSLHVVHRIDKQTSGVVVFARTHSALLRLKQLFRLHDIERRYMAIAHGSLKARTFHSRLVADRGDGKRGSTFNPKLGRESVTHVKPIEFLPSATLIQCTLETGRTHQIRIHLAEAGFPLFGEHVYAKDQDFGFQVPRLMLHAMTLGFAHPVTALPLLFSAELPDDMKHFIDALRRK